MTRIVYTPESVAFWNTYYQKGHGMQVYSGVPYQRGAGLGSFLRRVLRFAWPIVREGGRQLMSEGLTSAADVANDVIQGEDWKKAAKIRALEGGSRVLTKAAERMKQKGDGVGVKGRKRSKPIKRNKQKKMDIFS